MLADLQGQIERITFTNDESGYTIAKVKVYGCRDLVTVVGNLLAPTPGEILKMQGEWTSHPKYGEQFRVVHYKSLVPASVYGMEKYLGSGLIKGIGPIMAKRIVSTFGRETLEVIEQEIEKLAEVEGIGKKRVEMVRKAWADQKEIRQVMLFLQSHGVSSGYATKIFKTYGNDAIEVVQENPPTAWPRISLASAFSPRTALPKSWGLPRIQNSGPRLASFTFSTSSPMRVMSTIPSNRS